MSPSVSHAWNWLFVGMPRGLTGMGRTLKKKLFPGVELLHMWTFDVDYITQNNKSL